MERRIALFLAGFLIVCGTLVLVPHIDLWASGLFYRPGSGFFLADWPPFHAVRAALPAITVMLVLGEAALLVAALARRPVFGVDARAAAFLLLALAIGPGLVVNTLFKDHWGRARPATVTQFGGDKRFTPAFVPSPACRSNCSFPAGDPAMGFYVVAFGLLLPAPRRRRAAIGGALALGAGLGVIRLAQGGHFLSDVIASGFLITAITWLLHRWIVVNDGLRQLARRLRHPSLALRRLVLLGIATSLAVPLSYVFLDRPLARAFHDGNPLLQRSFRIVTEFGNPTAYLLLAAGLGIVWGMMAARVHSAARARRLSLAAWRAAFVFTAVAGAGLFGDLLKPLFGRARPELLFRQGIFGFTWHGGRAAYWSFPSGHTITIVSLMMALSLIRPRGLPYFAAAAVLVAASRIIIAAHYLSDVLGGAFIAAAVVWAIWSAFRRAGVPLTERHNP